MGWCSLWVSSEDGWRSSSVLPMFTSALERGWSGDHFTWTCPPLPQVAASRLRYGRNLLKEAFCPKYTAQTLRAAARGGEGSWGGGRYLRFFLRRGDICSPGVFLCGRPAGRSDTSAPKSPPGSFPGSESSYESWSRFAKPHLIINKFDLGKKKRPQTT